jgi:outer membrane biosynthesis protein TonB
MAKKKTKSKARKSVKKPVKRPAKKAKAKAKPKAKAAKKAPAKKPAPAKKKAAAKKAGAKRKTSGPPAPVMPWRTALAGESLVGVVDDYFSHISVVTLTLQAPLNVGETIHVRGHTTDITQTVDSMQVEHKAVSSGNAGDGVGIKVQDKVRRGDYVYKVR